MRGRSVDSNYLGAAFIGQMIFVAQAVLGAMMWIGGGSGNIVRPDIHLLYGIFALVFLPFVYVSVPVSYTHLLQGSSSKST